MKKKCKQKIGFLSAKASQTCVQAIRLLFRLFKVNCSHVEQMSTDLMTI